MVSVSSCSDASNHPLIDALEVYARPYRAGTTALSSPPQPTVGNRASDDEPPSTLVVNTMKALEACSRLLGHALGLAATATPNVDQEEVALSEPYRELASSALSVLRKTCLAADKTRWRALRSSSRYLLAAAEPDAARRVDSMQSAYADEILHALVEAGGGNGDGASDGRIDEGSSMSPVRLTRVAQLCGHVCATRSMLLRGTLAPALADSCLGGGTSGGDNNSGSSNSTNSRLHVASRLVFPALMRHFWESCVWRRGGRASMQMVLRCILQLAVHEMRATGAAAAVAAAAVATSADSNSGGGGGNVEEFSEQEVLRAGLGQLMPLLQSNVARVSQASSAYLGTLLLGTLPAATDVPRSSSAAPPAVTGRRQAEDGGRARSTTATDATPESRVNAAATTGVMLSSQGVVSGTYAASAGSASEGEAEATSDPGTDSDADGEADGRSNAVSSVQLALEGLRRAGHLSTAAAGEGRGRAAGGDNPPRPGQEPPVDSLLNAAAPVTAFEDLVPSSVKRARTASSAARASTSGRNLASGRAGMDVGEAADQDSSSAAADVAADGERARGSAGATATAARPAASETSATTASRNAPGTNAAVAAAASRQICYRCDGCDDFPLQHVRYHCLVCADFDLCPQCYDVFHGPNSQFQGGNAIMLRSHSTSHGMVALQVCMEMCRAVFVSMCCWVEMVSPSLDCYCCVLISRCA